MARINAHFPLKGIIGGSKFAMRQQFNFFYKNNNAMLVLKKADLAKSSSPSLFIYFIVAILFILLALGCESDYERGRKSGLSAGYQKGISASHKTYKATAYEEFYNIGYDSSLTKALEVGEFNYSFYKCVIYSIIALSVGFFAQYFVFYILRRNNFMNDIDRIIMPNLEDVNISTFDVEGINNFVEKSLTQVGSTTQEKIIGKKHGQSQ